MVRSYVNAQSFEVDEADTPVTESYLVGAAELALISAMRVDSSASTFAREVRTAARRAFTSLKLVVVVVVAVVAAVSGGRDGGERII